MQSASPELQPRSLADVALPGKAVVSSLFSPAELALTPSQRSQAVTLLAEPGLGTVSAPPQAVPAGGEMSPPCRQPVPLQCSGCLLHQDVLARYTLGPTQE